MSASYEPFDPDYTASVIQEIFDPIVRRYFRAELIGGERIPQQGPLILAPNHSGNSFPYDGMVLDGLLWERDGLRPEGEDAPLGR